MVNVDLLNNKLAQLSDYFSDLQELKGITLDDFQLDKRNRRYAERTLHLAIECCLDIGSHIIADNGWREPIDNKDIFTVLAENGLLGRDLLTRLQKMAQFSNLLVHDYAKIDPEIVYSIMQKNLSDIQEYIKTVERLL
jgi:uncharacterized protein YutE (UPF0331/DUF86 family)